MRGDGAPDGEHGGALAGAAEEAAAAVTDGAPTASALEAAMHVLERLLGASHAALYLLEGRGQGIAVEATYRVAADELRPRYALGVVGRVCDSGKPVVVPVVCQEPMAMVELLEPAAWQDPRLSLVCVPLPGPGRCHGALSVYFASDSAPLAERVAAARAVAAAFCRSLSSGRAPSVTGNSVSRPGRAKRQGSGARSERTAFEYSNMIGTSVGMRRVYEEIAQVSRTTATALILGESGTGKELVAQAIHDNSERAAGPFVKVNSAAFPETLFESELFGHEKGAFTGAVGRKKGRLDRAQGGTLFLDEIGELPLATQVKLLRVLQSREYERVGGTETLRADVRLVAATNKNMLAAVANGTFREDLYYRLNVFTIVLPPLRERAGDIPTLAEFFLEKYAREHRRAVRRIASSALEALARHSWPGNVRELENAIERAVVVCSDAVLEERHLPAEVRSVPRAIGGSRPTLTEAVEQLERRMIEEALEEAGGNVARASRALGTTERIVRYKMQKYRLTPPNT